MKEVPALRGARNVLVRAASAAALVLAPWLVGCGGHEARTLKMRTALDVGDAKGAIKAINEELEVASEKELPKDIKGDNALLVLDRGSIQQGLVRFDLSKQDFEAADKAIDMLDLARNAGDSIGEYVFSGSSGKYQAPPYEKLMINTLDMINYLEQRDLNGARVEARRLSVMQKYYRDALNQPNNPVLGLGSLLAGFTFEKSGETDEALRYYDEALAFSGYSSIEDPIARLAALGSYRSPRLKALVEKQRSRAGSRSTRTAARSSSSSVTGASRTRSRSASRSVSRSRSSRTRSARAIAREPTSSRSRGSSRGSTSRRSRRGRGATRPRRSASAAGRSSSRRRSTSSARFAPSGRRSREKSSSARSREWWRACS